MLDDTGIMLAYTESMLEISKNMLNIGNIMLKFASCGLTYILVEDTVGNVEHILSNSDINRGCIALIF